MVTVDETLVREILERLIRMEALAEANNERLNQRIDETNRRIDGLTEQVRETNRRIDDTNLRIDNLNHSVNQRIDDTNDRIDNQTGSLRRELRSDINRQTFLILGFGAALIASVVTTVIFG